MDLKIHPVNPTFQYKSVLKKDFRRGLIPLKRGGYGDKLVRGEETVEHIIPKSKGGKSNIFNYMLVSLKQNQKRGNRPFKDFVKLEPLLEYFSVMLDVKTEDIDGVEYVKGIIKTMLKALREGK